MVTAFLDNTTVILPTMHTISGSESSLNHGVTLNYDDVTDELQILFAVGKGRRHSNPVKRYLSVLVNTDSEDTFGFMVENFLTHAVHELPRLKPVAMDMQLGERPYRDPNLYRQDTPPRASLPDSAWKDAAHDAIHTIVEITGGVLE